MAHGEEVSARRGRLPAAGLAATALLCASGAAAQSYQCRMPRVTAAPQVERDGPARGMPVTGYTLALSWSPEFCKPREGQRSHALQCSGANGRFGMVVHGLWPEGARSWPQWCPARRRPTGADIAGQLCVSPSVRLVARQWAKHGACTGWPPATYYKVTNILYRSLRFPDFDRLSREDGLTAGMLRERFVTANPGFFAGAVGVKLNQRGWLEELRLCYGRDFRPARCDTRRFGARDADEVKIWRGL